jgi:DNA-binding LytR/AlgR family response regulator
MNPTKSFLFIREGRIYRKISFDTLLYVEARQNYTRFVSAQDSGLAHATLKDWENLLPPAMFCRIHRGFIVSIPQILSFDNRSVWLPGAQLPIGGQYRKALPRKVMLLGAERPREPQDKKRSLLAI